MPHLSKVSAVQCRIFLKLVRYNAASLKLRMINAASLKLRMINAAFPKVGAVQCRISKVGAVQCRISKIRNVVNAASLKLGLWSMPSYFRRDDTTFTNFRRG